MSTISRRGPACWAARDTLRAVEAETGRLRRRFGTLRGVAYGGDQVVATGLMRFAMDVPKVAAEE